MSEAHLNHFGRVRLYRMFTGLVRIIGKFMTQIIICVSITVGLGIEPHSNIYATTEVAPTNQLMSYPQTKGKSLRALAATCADGFNGKGYRDSSITVLRNCEAAYLNGDRDSVARLGYMYITGTGTEKNIEIGLSYLNKAIALKSTVGLYLKAQLYCNAIGVSGNLGTCHELYERAIELGDTDSMREFGKDLIFGHGVWQDTARGESLLLRAAKAKNLAAIVFVANLYDEDNIEESEGTTTEIRRNDKKALYWYRLCAQLGESSCMETLGRFYESGRGGLKVNNKRASFWYLRAKESGHVDE